MPAGKSQRHDLALNRLQQLVKPPHLGQDHRATVGRAAEYRHAVIGCSIKQLAKTIYQPRIS